VTAFLPDPAMIRERSADALVRLRLPPPAGFPLLWAAGARGVLRQQGEIEARLAVVSVVLACCLGTSQEAAMAWLLEAHLLDQVTQAEWRFVTAGHGDRRVYALHHEAAYVLAWALGIAMDLDPTRPAPGGLLARLPNLAVREPYARWRARTLVAPRRLGEVAAQLDLYACLDWSAEIARRHRLPLPGSMNSDAVGQRRLALEWIVVAGG